MPTIEIGSIELLDLQIRLQQEGLKAPDEIPDFPEWAEENDCDDPEQYQHDVAIDHALRKLLSACPICGDVGCDRGVSWVGAAPIHSDQHPEVKAERAMDEQGGHW